MQIISKQEYQEKLIKKAIGQRLAQIKIHIDDQLEKIREKKSKKLKKRGIVSDF